MLNLEGFSNKDIILKGDSYVNSPQNKKLNRVGKPYSPSTQIYHSSFTSAVQTAKEDAEKRGFEVDEDDWWNRISTGSGKPKNGSTFQATIGLTKKGKSTSKALHISVYDRGSNVGNRYELTHYIN